MASKDSSERKSHTSLTLNQKVRVIEHREEGMSKVEIGQNLGLLHQTDSQVVNAKEKFSKGIRSASPAEPVGFPSPFQLTLAVVPPSGPPSLQLTCPSTLCPYPGPWGWSLLSAPHQVSPCPSLELGTLATALGHVSLWGHCPDGGVQGC